MQDEGNVGSVDSKKATLQQLRYGDAVCGFNRDLGGLNVGKE
jgi:hypothetical protein